jgi:Ca-activated chloride channel family protein
MIRKLAVLIILLIPIVASAQVTLDEVKSGTLLLKTNQPGVYVAAPTVETDVDLRVRGLILRGEVTQRFLNPQSSCVEAVYAFPLPEDSAVDTLRMKVGNRVIEGEIKEKEDAKKTYETAKRQGKKVLLTQERPYLFTVSIANIGPGENVTIAIRRARAAGGDGGGDRTVAAAGRLRRDVERGRLILPPFGFALLGQEG